ncbi:MAG: glycoside hydrolase family 88 protein [Eubacteriales bacterium]|jgi:unsaturated chondroitin disaccharide hydrolase|nr:glycoside hydrolase family 88 protein [Eubacteriales bacterium]
MNKWIDEVWEKTQKKLKHTISQMPHDMIPYTTKNGKFVAHEHPYWWTNGFWAGIMWLMYQATGDEDYKALAQKNEIMLDKALYGFEGLHHDVGFMWLPSSVASYKTTQNAESRKRGLMAAAILASRFNTQGNFIRAWNGDATGWAIIDSLMNIPLLYWASDEIKDPRYQQIAIKHADTLLETFVRPDGSINHINVFDPDTGEYLESLQGQAYAVGSCWSRGQAWAIYGFVLSYHYTKQIRYLDAAKLTAHYFIAALSAQDEFVPNCDFRSPKQPVYKDTTAGMIAASGLIDIAKYVGEHEKDLYLTSALKLLRETEKRYCDWTLENDAIVQMGTEAYNKGHNIPIIYGDYYFVEAILKLKGKEGLFV